MDCKNIKKIFFSRWLFEIIHIIRFEIWDLRSRDLKIFLGYDINYLSIWPFMCHPWFPTRKASKLFNIYLFSAAATAAPSLNIEYFQKLSLALLKRDCCCVSCSLSSFSGALTDCEFLSTDCGSAMFQNSKRRPIVEALPGDPVGINGVAKIQKLNDSYQDEIDKVANPLEETGLLCIFSLSHLFYSSTLQKFLYCGVQKFL